MPLIPFKLIMAGRKVYKKSSSGENVVRPAIIGQSEILKNLSRAAAERYENLKPKRYNVQTVKIRKGREERTYVPINGVEVEVPVRGKPTNFVLQLNKAELLWLKWRQKRYWKGAWTPEQEKAKAEKQPLRKDNQGKKKSGNPPPQRRGKRSPNSGRSNPQKRRP